MQKKKIVFIIPSLGIGGAEVFCVNLVSEFSKYKDFDVHLIVFFNVLSDKYKKRLSENVTIHFLDKKPGFSFSFLRRLRDLLSFINPDVINTHSSHSLRYVLLIKKIKNIPLIHTITNDPTIHSKLCYFLFKKRMHQKSWNKLTFVGISDLISNNLAAVYKYPRSKIVTIYNGLYELKSNNGAIKKYDFFNCANMTPVKRQDLLIRALSKCKSNATLVIAGDGAERENLIHLAKSLNVYDRITFMGSLLDPSDLYFESKCFILTSYSEGNPICINEAMSAGLPIIATKVGGIPDLIAENENGFLFERDETPDGLANLMDFVLNLSSKKLNEIKICNQEKVKQFYMDNVAKKYLELILDKLGR